MMAMFCGLRPGTAAAMRFSTACTPSRSSRAAPLMVRTTLACAFLPVAGEGFAPGQDEVDAGGADALQGADGAGQLAFQGAGLADALLEGAGGEAVAAVEDLVADGAAGRQALLGEQHAGAVHLVGGHQDAGAARLRLVRDAGAVELVHDLPGFPQVEVGVEQGHRGGAGAERERADQAEGDERHERQRAQLHRPQGAQPGQHRHQPAHANRPPRSRPFPSCQRAMRRSLAWEAYAKVNRWAEDA